MIFRTFRRVCPFPDRNARRPESLLRGPNCSLLRDGDAGGARANCLSTCHAIVEVFMASDFRVCRLLDFIMPGLQTCPTEVSVRVSERRRGGLNSRRFSLGFFRMEALEFDGSMFWPGFRMYFLWSNCGGRLNCHFSRSLFRGDDSVCMWLFFFLTACNHDFSSGDSTLCSQDFSFLCV